MRPGEMIIERDGRTPHHFTFDGARGLQIRALFGGRNARGLRTPAWYACPTRPPAPSTKPILAISPVSFPSTFVFFGPSTDEGRS